MTAHEENAYNESEMRLDIHAYVDKNDKMSG
jgi:hypothetical protein